MFYLEVTVLGSNTVCAAVKTWNLSTFFLIPDACVYPLLAQPVSASWIPVRCRVTKPGHVEHVLMTGRCAENPEGQLWLLSFTSNILLPLCHSNTVHLRKKTHDTQDCSSHKVKNWLSVIVSFQLRVIVWHCCRQWMHTSCVSTHKFPKYDQNFG